MRLRGQTSSRVCASCAVDAPWAVVQTRRWLTVCGLPLVPVESSYVIMCPVCSRGFEVEPRAVPGLLRGTEDIPASYSHGEFLVPRRADVGSRRR